MCLEQNKKLFSFFSLVTYTSVCHDNYLGFLGALDFKYCLCCLDWAQGSEYLLLWSDWSFWVNGCSFQTKSSRLCDRASLGDLSFCFYLLRSILLSIWILTFHVIEFSSLSLLFTWNRHVHGEEKRGSHRTGKSNSSRMICFSEHSFSISICFFFVCFWRSYA